MMAGATAGSSALSRRRGDSSFSPTADGDEGSGGGGGGGDGGGGGAIRQRRLCYAIVVVVLAAGCNVSNIGDQFLLNYTKAHVQRDIGFTDAQYGCD